MDFRSWWGEHHVAVRTRGSKVLRHPATGDLALDWDALACAHDPDQQLVVWTAEPGTPSHDGLRILASLATTEAAPASSGNSSRADVEHDEHRNENRR